MNKFSFFKSSSLYINDNPVPELSGNNFLRFYGVFRPDGIVCNYEYPITVRDTVGNSDYNVFFNDKGEIGFSSKISTTTIPGNDTLYDLVKMGNSFIEVVKMTCIYTGYELFKDKPSNPVVDPPEFTPALIVENGKLIRDYGKVSLKFLNDGGFVNFMTPEIEEVSSNFSIATSFTSTNPGISSLFATNYTSWQGLRLNTEYKSNRDQDLFYVQNNNVRRTIPWTVGLPQNVNVNVVATTNKVNNLLTLYRDEFLQGTSFVDNRPPKGDRTMLGAFYDRGREFEGNLRYLSICNEALSSDQADSLNTKLNQYLRK
jgi:hypothetical protein